MNKKIIIVFIFSIFVALFFSFSGISVHAQNVDDTLNKLNETANVVPAFKGSTGNTYNTDFFAGYAGKIIGIILSFVGVLFLGLMVFAGVQWMMAQGNEQNVQKAKDLIVSSIIGLIIVFAAYALTTFIGNNFLK